jgi:hypothetical protein
MLTIEHTIVSYLDIILPIELMSVQPTLIIDIVPVVITVMRDALELMDIIDTIIG